jgi:hypothetical protein
VAIGNYVRQQLVSLPILYYIAHPSADLVTDGGQYPTTAQYYRSPISHLS